MGVQYTRWSLRKARNRGSTHLFIFLPMLPSDDMIHTAAANPSCRHSLPQPALRPSKNPLMCRRTSCVLALTRLTPPHSLLVAVLGCRWRRSALRPDMGVPRVLWVVHTANSHNRRAQTAPLEVSRFTRLTHQSACVRLNLHGVRARRPCSLRMRQKYPTIV
jgi:hypothetical protein